MLKLLKGLAALAGLAVIVAGVPWLLLTVAGNPIPSWDTVAGLFTHPDYGGSFLMGSLLPIIAWIAWASFVFSLLTVIPSALRGVKPPQIRGLGIQQKTASALLGAVIVMFGGLAGAGAATAAEPAAPAISHSVTSQQTHQTNAPAVDTTTSDAVVMKSLTVNEGDSLWGIAESSLGDGDRYPELYEASKDIVQADGQTISNPDIIQPGWAINVPTMTQASTPTPPVPAPAPVQEQAAPAPEVAPGAAASGEVAAPAATPAQDQNQDQAAATSAEQPAADSSASASAESTDANDSGADEEPIADMFEVRTVGGIGGLLAASVLSVLGIRRFQQRRRRKVGERISMPSPEITSTELELRAVENPKGVDDIDKALRYLAAWARENDERLPKLFALRLSPTNVELYLDEPADLPAPFTLTVPDKTAWVVDPDEIPAFDPRPTAPYPGLVTLGQDASDGHILVDVEQIGSLNISGPNREITEGALTALAVELACSQWADDLQVTVVGFAPELANAFKTGRVQHLDDVRALMSSLRGRARAYSRTFKDLGVEDIAHARLVADTDTWTPEIVLLNELPDEETCKELAALIERVPRVGIAAITNGQLSGDWALRIEKDFSATLSPAGIPIQAQVIMGKNYEQIVQTLAVAEEAAVAAKTAAADAPETVSAPTTPIEPDAYPDEEPAPIREPVEVSAEAEGTHETPAQLADEEPPAAPETQESEASTHEVITATELPAADHPMIRVLGSVRVEGAKGIEPRTAKASYVAGCTAIATYLVLHPGATRAELHHAIWPNERHDDQKNAQKRNQYVSRTRRWLGTDDDGETYLPVVTGDSHALLDHVTSDWHLWKALVGDDYRTTSTADLAAAMSLVNGQPFTAAPAKWFSFSDLDKQDMISEIVDVAHELTERALLAGDVAMARNASTKACIVDPASEIPVRDRLRTEAMAKDWESFDRVSEDLTARLAEMEDEPEDETAELIDQLRGRLRLAS